MEVKCVPFKITVEGQEIDAFITEKNWELVLEAINKNKKKTGYERVDQGKEFFYQHSNGNTECGYDNFNGNLNLYFNSANYYSDKTVAENNSRADKLMRQLRRFAVEHRKNELDWSDKEQRKFYIGYDCSRKVFDVECDTDYITSHTVYFDSYESAENAIDVFCNDLKWYFTEYKDSL